jgi:methanogenic corrinoid protein MtbC1
LNRNEEFVSIADVSEQTGIGIDTLRVWERRYGAPKPVRLPSGHRRYTMDQVRWLRHVAEAISRGHRPSSVLRKNRVELEALAPLETCETISGSIRRLLDLAIRFEERDIVKTLKQDLKRLGNAAFVSRRIAPLLGAVGSEWREGRLEIRHEHFVSEIVEDLLRAMRGAVKIKKNAPLVVLATLPGEHHSLGLQMASLLLVEGGMRVRMLGTDTPNGEIVEAVESSATEAVGISVSLATCGVETERRLADLRESLADDVRLIAGGQGAKRLRRGVRGVEYFSDLEDFETRLSAGST